MRMRWVAKTPPLSPPPSADELAWWKANRQPVRQKVMLTFGGPFFVVYLVIYLLKASGSPKALISLMVLPAFAYGAAVVQWLASQKHFRDQHIRWKRVREELGAGEPDAALPAPVKQG